MRYLSNPEVVVKSKFGMYHQRSTSTDDALQPCEPYKKTSWPCHFFARKQNNDANLKKHEARPEERSRLGDFALQIWRGKFLLSEERIKVVLRNGNVCKCVCECKFACPGRVRRLPGSQAGGRTPHPSHLDTCRLCSDSMGDYIDNIKCNNCGSSFSPHAERCGIKSMCHSLWFIAENNRASWAG